MHLALSLWHDLTPGLAEERFQGKTREFNLRRQYLFYPEGVWSSGLNLDMNFNDIMVLITGVLCFLTGIILVPFIDLFLKSAAGFSIPAALTGVIDLLLIICIVWVHTFIVLYRQKRMIRGTSGKVKGFFRKKTGDEKMDE